MKFKNQDWCYVKRAKSKRRVFGVILSLVPKPQPSTSSLALRPKLDVWQCQNKKSKTVKIEIGHRKNPFPSFRAFTLEGSNKTIEQKSTSEHPLFILKKS